MEGQRMDERERIRMIQDIVTKRQMKKTRTEKVLEDLKRERMLRERKKVQKDG